MDQVVLPVFKIVDGVYASQALRPINITPNPGNHVTSFSDVSVFICREPMQDGAVVFGSFEEANYEDEFWFPRLGKTLTEEQLVVYRDQLIKEGYRLIFDGGIPIGLFDATDSPWSAYRFISNMNRSVFDVFELSWPTQRLIYELSMSYTRTHRANTKTTEIVLSLSSRDEVLCADLNCRIVDNFLFD